MPQSPLAAGEKLYCLSYAPFRGRQTPLDPTTQISAAQIEDDLSRLAKLTDCVRTYSIDYGLDQIAGIAARHGLKVMQGLWLSSHPDKNRVQIETAVALANRYPGHDPRGGGRQRGAAARRDVGDRSRRHHPRGEGAGARAGDLCRCVGVLAAQPRRRRGRRLRHHPYPALLGGLPDPGAQRRRPCGVDPPRSGGRPFAGKEVIIGEVGWPSAGRMREGALPSPANQARVIQDVLALAASAKISAST